MPVLPAWRPRVRAYVWNMNCVYQHCTEKQYCFRVLKVREFIPHDSRLRFSSLNHVQTDAFNLQNRTTGIMPLFALANAGVSVTGVDLSAGIQFVTLGVGFALVAGKPIGVIGATWLAVRMGWCRLAAGVSWGGVCLVGRLAGIGFTMSIFIAMLAFADERLLNAAKPRVLSGW